MSIVKVNLFDPQKNVKMSLKEVKKTVLKIIVRPIRVHLFAKLINVNKETLEMTLFKIWQSSNVSKIHVSHIQVNLCAANWKSAMLRKLD